MLVSNNDIKTLLIFISIFFTYFSFNKLERVEERERKRERERTRKVEIRINMKEEHLLYAFTYCYHILSKVNSLFSLFLHR